MIAFIAGGLFYKQRRKNSNRDVHFTEKDLSDPEHEKRAVASNTYADLETIKPHPHPLLDEETKVPS